jgi:hypothetical protein
MRYIAYYLKQLLPLTYRTRYFDGNGRLHFAVWRQWFGRCFQTDDVVVQYDAEMARRCLMAVERGDYQTLGQVIAELKARSRGQEPAVLEPIDPDQQ